MTSSQPVHIGIDLAWGSKKRTGLAAVSADGRLLASGSAHHDEEILAWIADHGDVLGVVAIDAPLVVTNARGRRRCESLIHAAFGRYDASPHSTNLGKPEFNPPRGAVLAAQLGLPLDPDGPRSAVAIEVYPHPAMVGLWELDLILKYKHKSKYPFEFRAAEFSRLLDLLESERSLQVSAVPPWSELRAIAAAASRHGDLNRIEDEVDGIVCAWLAWLWATGDPRLQVYGDVADGYIVAPPAPTHSPRSRSDRMAPRPRSGVQPALQSTSEMPITAAPAFTLDGPAARWALTPAEARSLEASLSGMRTPDAHAHYLAVATYTARAETADRVAELLTQLAKASRLEPGNISYAVAIDLERPHVFTIVEVYDDADAFTAHRESAHFTSIGKLQIIPLLESRVVVAYEGTGVIR